MNNKCLFGLYLAVLVAAAWAAEIRPDGGSFTLTLTFHGPETKTWYRAMLASPDKSQELARWKSANSLLGTYFLTSTISPNEVVALQETLRSLGMERFGTNEFQNDANQRYVISVLSNGGTVHMPIGLGTNALSIVKSLRSVLKPSSSEPLKKIEEQLAYFIH